MAEELELEPVGKKGGGKKKLIIIIVAVLVLLIGAGVAWFLLAGSSGEPAKADSTEQTQDKEGKAEPKEVGEALYVALPQPFVFNVPGNQRSRLVQISVQVMVRGADNEALAKQHLPLIESVLLSTFSQFTEEQLSTSQGRENLRTAAQQAVRDALTPVAGKPVVERVLFTGFVMQ
ncbi:flagellar basal body-associated protein FliL [Gallaecimonas pentaromativorans]|uniref:Flagellar protein FliL n=1 Tax=Gallaecimonas pentaromativorans TaxID=584787 RepID=A0A3N1NUR1_9GAMM|nr:flagellar basal body-associated protein FliL [Gallaecimonas pentaromativorans]ROQ22582.1 flagellar FliL protein [Gallaecimonas pentaromativorans]